MPPAAAPPATAAAHPGLTSRAVQSRLARGGSCCRRSSAGPASVSAQVSTARELCCCLVLRRRPQPAGHELAQGDDERPRLPLGQMRAWRPAVSATLATMRSIVSPTECVSQLPSPACSWPCFSAGICRTLLAACSSCSEKQRCAPVAAASAPSSRHISLAAAAPERPGGEEAGAMVCRSISAVAAESSSSHSLSPRGSCWPGSQVSELGGASSSQVSREVQPQGSGVHLRRCAADRQLLCVAERAGLKVSSPERGSAAGAGSPCQASPGAGAGHAAAAARICARAPPGLLS